MVLSFPLVECSWPEPPVGDVPAHRPREFNAGSTAMNVKVRTSAPTGLALTEWPLPAMCGR